MKKIFIAIFLFANIANAQLIKLGEARGLFMAVGVGPRFPIGAYADNRNIAVGFDVSFAYTDNEVLPVFLYTKFGYQHYPGKQGLYKISSYSSFSTNMISIEPGVRFFFPPIIEQDFLLMPLVEGGVNWALFENYHQFKIGSGKDNYVEQASKLGFHVGFGFSMFLMDVMSYLNVYPDGYQYLSLDLRIRIPIFVKV